MDINLVRQKKTAAILSIISNSVLITIKVIAGIISGSIGIISEAVHSTSDLLASIITLFSVSESSKPADNDHQFGHGKFEDLASFVEGLLIILAAFYIIYESVKKIVLAHSIEINASIGLWVMAIAVVANFFVSSFLFKIAHKTGSTALYADGEHLKTDIYSSLAVFVGLILVKVTGNPVYDPIVAIIVAIIIFDAGLKICVTAKNSLLDTSLSEKEVFQIKSIINNYLQNGVISLKNLRTRKSGVKKIIEMVLVVDKTMHISTSHEMCDEIEAKIEAKLHNTDITIHLEPNT